jgi:hypothetical protein
MDALDLFFWVSLMMMMLWVDWNSESSFGILKIYSPCRRGMEVEIEGDGAGEEATVWHGMAMENGKQTVEFIIYRRLSA